MYQNLLSGCHAVGSQPGIVFMVHLPQNRLLVDISRFRLEKAKTIQTPLPEACHQDTGKAAFSYFRPSIW